MKIFKLKYSALITIPVLMLLLNSLPALAETSNEGGMDMEAYTKYTYIVTIAAIAVLLFILMKESGKEYTEEEAMAFAKEKKPSGLKDFFHKYIQQDAPKNEEEILMDDDFDGIKELDNSIPPWFNYLFYGSMVFAVIYLLVFHVYGTGNVMLDEYTSEMTIAEMHKQELIRTGAFINEETVKRINEPEVIENGKAIFTTNCIVCHGSKGEGLVGPNLTDDSWLHGGGIKNVFKTIKYGVPAKGMISWQQQLNPKQIQDVANFVLSLQGSNPPNGKLPEGEKYTDDKQDK